MTQSALPNASELMHLKASNATGARYTCLCLVLTTLGLSLSQAQRLFSALPDGPAALAWGVGQVLLAFALLQWFVILHECGHGVLFRSRLWNVWVGHLAGFLCVVPFRSWCVIHGMHHKWTGWQDKDPTTAALVPRKLGFAERWLMNACWKYWVPAFSVLYRLTNFWNPGRLLKATTKTRARVQCGVNLVVLAAAYGLLLWRFGGDELLRTFGLGAALSLVMLDPIMISQHSHIPMQRSQGERVKAFTPLEQEVFTRSLRFPDWFSRSLLLHFDAHELHHIYPYVPGYRLREIDYAPPNEVSWWKWIRMARKMPAEVLLFQNRNDSGSEV